MAITNFEVYATRLRDERLDIKLKQTIAHELCESLECFQLQDYSRFVTILWPVIRDLLVKTPPVFISSAPEQVSEEVIARVIYIKDGRIVHACLALVYFVLHLFVEIAVHIVGDHSAHPSNRCIPSSGVRGGHNPPVTHQDRKRGQRCSVFKDHL